MAPIRKSNGSRRFGDIDIARLKQLARSLHAAIVQVAKNSCVKDLAEAYFQFMVVDPGSPSQFHQ
jgi:hypothetical protein